MLYDFMDIFRNNFRDTGGHLPRSHLRGVKAGFNRTVLLPSKVVGSYPTVVEIHP